MTTATWGALVGALLLLAAIADGAQIVVGDVKGWTTGFEYDAWVVSQNIQVRVGDTLVFHNPDVITHTVGLVADADSYQRCAIGDATSVSPILPGKNATVPVPATLAGQTMYAVCTVSGHCQEMQKIRWTVLAATSVGAPAMAPTPDTSDASDVDVNRYICWTTAMVLLIAACF